MITSNEVEKLQAEKQKRRQMGWEKESWYAEKNLNTHIINNHTLKGLL